MFILILLCVLALALHLFTKWGEAWREAKSQNRQPPGLLDYMRSIKPQVAIGVVGAALSFLGMVLMGWMNPGMAIACGYMGSSLCKKLVDQAQSSFGA